MSADRTSAKDQWLDTGYQHFAVHGPDMLSVNQLSREIGVARASFYHHFGDIDLFVEQLLARHWHICQAFNNEACRSCKKLVPDLYRELAKHPVSLQFNLQLFHHRSNPRYNYLFIKTFEATAEAFALRLFADHLGFKGPDKEVYNLWLTLGETWYSRLDPEDLSAVTLQQHGEAIMHTVSVFLNSELYAQLH